MTEFTGLEIAAALAAALPSGTVVTAAPAATPSEASEAIVTTFVGSTSADLALSLKNTSVLLEGADASGLISSVDVVRPALEAAAEVLGTGVLGQLERDDPGALLGDPSTEVFELTADGVKEPIGWFAVRTRQAGTVSNTQQFVAGNLSRISNVEMTLTVEIGRTRMAVRDVLGLEPGAVIELDRSAGAPADVLLNGRLIAYGEVVVVDQDYAVRITKILDAADSVA